MCPTTKAKELERAIRRRREVGMVDINSQAFRDGQFESAVRRWARDGRGICAEEDVEAYIEAIRESNQMTSAEFRTRFGLPGTTLAALEE